MNTIIENDSYLVNPEISGENFIGEHTFFYIKRGETKCYDGLKTHLFKPNEFGWIRKNRLARYTKVNGVAESEAVFIIFDEAFLKKFQKKHTITIEKSTTSSTFIQIAPNKWITDCTLSLASDSRDCNIMDRGLDQSLNKNIDEKRESLLVAILKSQPGLAAIIFDFGFPEKINLEAFMNMNYIFNINIQRFAYLTGRSLSAFKRDFKAIFHETPGRWLVRKRLEEAYFLMDIKGKKPSEFYLDLGFETLQHFSFAFKRLYKMTPRKFLEQKNKRARFK